MLVIAIACKGKEFLYKANTARKVSARAAHKVCEIVNKYNYLIKPGEIWHVYDVDNYDNAFYYAQTQKFTYGKNGIVKDVKY